MGHGDPDFLWSRGEELQHMTSFLQDLVRLRSVCGSTEGERAVAMRIVEEAQALGLSYEVVAKEEHRPNVIVSLGTDDGPTLFCFVAHIDTVDVGDEKAWVHGSAFEARVDEDGRMYGRGTCDCKAGVAVSMYALRRLKAKLPAPLTGRISLLCVVDEESGACSPLGLCHLLASGAITESVHGSIYAYPGRVVTVGHRGLLRLHIQVSGQPLHSGVSDWAMKRKGANAVSALCRLLTALEDDDSWPATASPAFPDLPFTLTPTILKGGTFESIVPESAAALVDIRLPPDVDADVVLARVEAIVARVMEACPPSCVRCRASVEVKVRIPAYQLPGDPAAHPLVQACIRAVEQVTGQPPPGVRGCGPANEGYMLGQAGIDCICGFGPLGGHAHGIDEYVEVGESLSQTVDIFEAVVLHLLHGHPPP